MMKPSSKKSALGHKIKKPPRSRKPPRPAGLLDADPQRGDLRNQAGIDDHLKRIRAWLKHYELTSRTHRDIHVVLERIAEHEAEDRLFLGVVGEFSSGKSTLLNALLRDNLLRTDILQGTTSAPTLLSHGPALGVQVRPVPLHPILGAFALAWKILSFPVVVWTWRTRDRDGMLKLLHESTAVEQVARRVAQVNVTHPAECLRSGMVIVDLPGTNAENPRHGQVTAAALTDFCDAAIIVIPADTAGSATLWEFLQVHIEPDVLRRCIFVLNKIDSIRRPRDRESLAENIRARIRRDLNVDQPRVVTAAPERVLEAAGLVDGPDDPDQAMTPDERQHWTAAFEQTERVLMTTLHEQKLLLQVERLGRLLQQVFGQLQEVLTRRDGEYRERHAALQAGLEQIPDLRQFVADAQETHCGVALEELKAIVGGTASALQKMPQTALRTLSQILFATSNRKELQAALEGPVRNVMAVYEKGLRNILREGIKMMEASAEAQHREFHKGFQVMYRNLASLGGRVRVDRAGALTGSISGGSAGSAMSTSLAADVSQLRKEDFFKTTGGAGVGAFVGSLVLPGIGTLLGGLFGGLFGALFGPSHQQVVHQAWERLETAVISGFETFYQQAVEKLAHAAGQIVEKLEAVIGRYAEQYRTLVREMIQRDEREAASLAEFRRTIERDLAEIQDRLRQLASARETLRAR